ncbi:serine/threonine-protein kinase [Streptomyces sp. SID5789]|uniref:serine/threonine-protein kinase n=1 Tax=Streptomyces sp. SID5789 TaxID=2690310 RepID=UPI00136ED0EE|nr:serine/threonine-protein kinase [Streptomyces sp. SID5789]MZE74799.1 protein kinase [Streptomyces sp. SID5789]
MSDAERAGTPRTDKSARLLAGRYRLGDVLGRGGMGTVWRAQDETLGRTVAVKELRFPGNIDEEEKRRLITRTLREAKAIARIRNNGAVTVYDVVEEDDRPWIVMELVEGKSLAEAIREDGLLEPKRAAEVGLAVLDVLRSAHREGILHRDVKPSNVLIAEDGRVVLTDFGIAQVEGDPSITSTGMLVGAPSYISPERARGHKPGPAADLWSLGGLLYAAVEGTPPYDKGSAIATLTAVMTENLEEPKNAGPLRDVIYGLLNKEPAHRLDDAGARAMLTKVIHAPAPDEIDPAEATKVVPIPPQPDERTGRGGVGGKRTEEAGERLRGALRSVRKAAVGAGAAGAAAASRRRQGGTGSGTGAESGSPGAGASGTSGTAASGTAGAAAATGSAQGSGAGAQGGNPPGGKRSSGWPVVPPPDLPARPVPRAPLTDVVPRRTLIVIAVIVALAVLGTVLALTLGGDDEKGAEGGNGGKPAASAGPSGETRQDDEGGTGTDGAASDPAADGDASGAPEGGASASGDADGGSPDAGKSEGRESEGQEDVAATHKGGQGYRLGLPEGWKFTSTGASGDRFTGPGGQKLLVAWTSTPKGDPVADWENQERYMVRSQYQKIRIEKVDYRGWNTADWEFTYADGGTKYRTVDRGFVVNDHQGYALMYTAKADDWDGDLRRNTWQTLTKSFEPKS